VGNLELEGGLFLYRFQLVSLLCYWIVGVVGGRGLLHQYLLAGALKRAALLASSRERFAVMEGGTQFSSMQQKLELEREDDEL
jgi:hypothetical protein